MKIFYDYINEIFNFYKENGVEIEPLPKVIIDKTECNEFDPFIQTAHYDPNQNSITLYINNRHVKDILRSFCHELIHHNQFLTNDNYIKMDMSGSLNENQQLEEIEADAYQRGNLMFRKWTETYTK